MVDIDNGKILNAVIQIARQAGDVIMAIYGHDLQDTVYKADASPLTLADTRANDFIVAELQKLTPTVAIISEESLNEPTANVASSSSEVWLVDPLDGTKEFLKHNDEFTVNIALIQGGVPVLGVVFAPALGVMYYAAAGHGAYKQSGSTSPSSIRVSASKRQPIIVVSRSHPDQATQRLLNGYGPHDLLRLGSSLKLCYVADGSVDIYPRLSPIMEWDIAAGDAILRAAGGTILETDSTDAPLYNKANLHQAAFIAAASRDAALSVSTP